MDESVRFLGARRDVPEILALADVFVLTSHMEANPVSILEAMAVEKPVVATRVGSVPETVLDGKTGFLATPGSAEEIASRMVELLRSPDAAAAMGRAAREEVIVHWSVERMVNGYEDLLSEILRAQGVGIVRFALEKVDKRAGGPALAGAAQKAFRNLLPRKAL